MISSLSSHKINSLVLGVVTEYMLKCDLTDRSKDPPLTQKELYAYIIKEHLCGIWGCIDQLHLAIALLSGYKKNLMPEELNRHNYITYNIENYLFRITSVYDRCLRMTNTVFQLGLPPNHCNDNTILENSNIKNTSAGKVLVELKKYMEDYRKHRNMIAHVSTYTDDSLQNIGYANIFQDLDTFSSDALQNLFKSYTDVYILKKKREFTQNVKKLDTIVGKYFDALYDEVRIGVTWR